ETAASGGKMVSDKWHGYRTIYRFPYAGKTRGRKRTGSISGHYDNIDRNNCRSETAGTAERSINPAINGICANVFRLNEPEYFFHELRKGNEGEHGKPFFI